ncbi:MAG: Rqc2 family fibronectin-binding protein [Bacillota bacterium]
MALDGIMLSAVKNELENKIIDSRINKIYQPEEKILTINLRQPGESFKLLISNHPQRSRVHLTELNFENPPKPPDFCMLLRKYLTNGKITDIKQPGFERVLTIEIESNRNIYYLILEIMGRYSNSILINSDRIILDAMKRISKKISRERQLYPGITYQPPPPQNKLNPLEVNKKVFLKKIGSDFEDSSYKAILNNFRGIGPDMAKEIIYRKNLDYNKSYSEYNSEEKELIWKSFENFFQQVTRGKFTPCVGVKGENIIYTSAYNLSHQRDNITEEIVFENPGKLFDYYFEEKVKKRKYKDLKQRLNNIIDSALDKNDQLQRKFKGIIKDSKSAEKYKKMGELLKANMYKVEEGKKQIKAIDYFDSGQNEISIKLDSDLSPGENVERYFKKYDKAKKMKKHAKRELGKLVHEEKYLNQVKLNIEQAETSEDLAEIREELREENYIKKKQKSKNNRKNNKPLPPHKFKSSQGYDILVGRNNKQNDYITKKLANNQDIWLHTKKIAGAHVIIRNHNKEEIPEKTIKEAAVLAATFSQAKMSENVPIDYTEIKNVNKPKGARPGLVYYDYYQTLYVDPDPELAQKLKIN